MHHDFYRHVHCGFYWVELRTWKRIAWHPDPAEVTSPTFSSRNLFIFTHAGELFWVAVLTQCEPSDIHDPVTDRGHQRLYFLSGEFKRPQLGWTIYEEEGFSIAEAFHRLYYMLISEQDTRIFTEHRNLLFVFAPSTLEPIIGKLKMYKVLRWAV